MQRRSFLVGVAAILVFGAGMAFIVVQVGLAPRAEAPLVAATEAAPPASSRPAADGAAEAPTRPAPPTEPSAAPALGMDRVPAKRPRIIGRASRESALPPPSRVVTKSLRRELKHGTALQATLARCAGRGEHHGRPAVLMLHLETQEGKVRIVDAPVHARGDAGDALVTCAQSALRNQIIAAPAARPGNRNQMPLTLAFHETR